MDGAGSCESLIQACSFTLTLSSGFISSAFMTSSSDFVEELYECGEEEGLIDDCGGEVFTFVHDKVQEAALSLIPDSGLIKFRIGEVLCRSSNELELENLVFVVAGLLISRIDLVPVDDATRLEIARLHHLAGKKAMQIAAFRSASVYFKVVIDLFPEDTWKEDRAFCLDLYSSATESE
jgi:predicted ATPase